MTADIGPLTLEDLRRELRHERSELRREFDRVLQHYATRADLANLKAEMVKWFAGVLVLILVNVIGTLVTLVVALGA